MSVRAAESRDVDRVAALQVAQFHEDAGTHDPRVDLSWPAREGHADIARFVAGDGTTVLVAELDDGPDRSADVVGFLAGYRTESSPTRQPGGVGVLRSLYVEPIGRGRGLGSDLVDAFVVWARDQGCVEVTVDHYAANDAAARLYERCGFGAATVSRVRRL